MLWGLNVWMQDLRLVFLCPVTWNRGTQTGIAACGSWQSRGSPTSRLNRGLRLPTMGQSHGSSADQLRGECGTGSALVRHKWVEPRLAALVGPVYIYRTGPLRVKHLQIDLSKDRHRSHFIGCFHVCSIRCISKIPNFSDAFQKIIHLVLKWCCPHWHEATPRWALVSCHL